MVPTKDHTPHVPVTVDEVLHDVERCRELGASVFHVHAREEDGRPTHNKESFRPIVEGIREIDPELVVCVTCSGRSVAGLEQRADVLELDGDARPDMASLTLGSNNFRTQESVNSPETIRGLASRMQEVGILPELEVFEPGMLAFGQRLMAEGLLPERSYVNVLLGNMGTSPLTPASLAAFLSLVPDGWAWSLAGIGAAQLDANVTAMAAGGHVRTGIEDNIWLDRGRTEHATNAALVERIARIAGLMDRPGQGAAARGPGQHLPERASAASTGALGVGGAGRAHGDAQDGQGPAPAGLGVGARGAGSRRRRISARGRSAGERIRARQSRHRGARLRAFRRRRGDRGRPAAGGPRARRGAEAMGASHQAVADAHPASGRDAPHLCRGSSNGSPPTRPSLVGFAGRWLAPIRSSCASVRGRSARASMD